MGRKVMLRYEHLEASVEVDVDERRIVNVQLLWPDEEGIVRPVRPATDDARELERLAREVVSAPDVKWPQVKP